MATYKGRTVSIERSAEEIVDKFADLSRFKDNLDALPEEERAKSATLSLPPIPSLSTRLRSGKSVLRWQSVRLAASSCVPQAALCP